MPRLAGKVCLITGAARGQGAAEARLFAAEGGIVWMTDVLDDEGQDLASEIGARYRHLDVRDEMQWSNIVGEIIETDARLDVLINNAGMSPLYKSLTHVSQDLFDKVINVNLRGPFRLSALFGQQMFNDGNGSIINVSSIAAAQPSPHEVPYGAAKAGLHSLTKSFSRAYAPYVRVNCIMPGPFLTDISDAWSDATHESLKHLPLGRGGHPDEVVGAALYFASEASSFTTGAVLKIDGGSIASTS